MKFKTLYNYEQPELTKQDQPTKTVPNQAFTIRQIINRNAKGLPVTGIKVPIYNEDGLLPDLRNLDISEIYDLQRRVEEGIKKAKDQIAKKKEEERLKETEEFYRKKFQVEEATVVTDKNDKPAQ